MQGWFNILNVKPEISSCRGIWVSYSQSSYQETNQGIECLLSVNNDDIHTTKKARTNKQTNSNKIKQYKAEQKWKLLNL